MEQNPFLLLPKNIWHTLSVDDSSVYAVVDHTKSCSDFIKIVLVDNSNGSLQQQFDSWVKCGRKTDPPLCITLQNVQREFPNYAAVAGNLISKEKATALGVTIHPDFQLIQTTSNRNMNKPIISPTKRLAPSENEGIEAATKKQKLVDGDGSKGLQAYVPLLSLPFFHDEFHKQLMEFLQMSQPSDSSSHPLSTSTTTFTSRKTFKAYAISSLHDREFTFGDGMAITPFGVSSLSKISDTERPVVNNGIEAAYRRFNSLGILSPLLEYEVKPAKASKSIPATICWNWLEDFSSVEDEEFDKEQTVATGSTVVAVGITFQVEGVYFTIDVGRPSDMTNRQLYVPGDSYWMMMDALPLEARHQVNIVSEVYYCRNWKDFFYLHKSVKHQYLIPDTTLFYTKLWLYILGDFIGESLEFFFGFDYSSVLIGDNPATTIINPKGQGNPFDITIKWIEAMKSGAIYGTYLGNDIGVSIAIIDALGAAAFPVYHLQLVNNTVEPKVQYEVASMLVRFVNGTDAPHQCYTIDNDISSPGSNAIDWPERMPSGLEILKGSNLLACRNGEIDFWLCGYEIAIMLVQFQIRSDVNGMNPEIFSGYSYHDVLSLCTPKFSHRVLSPFAFNEVLPPNPSDCQVLIDSSTYSNRLALHLFMGRIYSYSESLCLYMNNMTGNTIHYIPIDRKPQASSWLKSLHELSFRSAYFLGFQDQIRHYIENIQFQLFGVLLPNRSQEFLWRWSQAKYTRRPNWTLWGATTPHLVQGCTLFSLMVTVPSIVLVPLTGTRVNFKHTAIFQGSNIVGFCPQLVTDNTFRFAFYIPESIFIMGRIMNGSFSCDVLRCVWECPLEKPINADFIKPRLRPIDLFHGLDCFDCEFKVVMTRLDISPPVFRFPLFIIPPSAQEKDRELLSRFISDELSYLSNTYEHIPFPQDNVDETNPYSLLRQVASFDHWNHPLIN